MVWNPYQHYQSALSTKTIQLWILKKQCHSAFPPPPHEKNWDEKSLGRIHWHSYVCDISLWSYLFYDAPLLGFLLNIVNSVSIIKSINFDNFLPRRRTTTKWCKWYFRYLYSTVFWKVNRSSIDWTTVYCALCQAILQFKAKYKRIFLRGIIVRYGT